MLILYLYALDVGATEYTSRIFSSDGSEPVVREGMIDRNTFIIDIMQSIMICSL